MPKRLWHLRHSSGNSPSGRGEDGHRGRGLEAVRSRPGSRQGAGGARKGDLWLVDAGRLRRRLLWSCHPGEQTGSFMVCRWLSPGGWLPTGGVWSCRRADPVNEPEGSSLQPRLADRAQAQSQRRVASGRARRGRWGPRKAVQRPAQEWSQSWALEVRPRGKRGHGGARARAQEQWPGGPTRLEIAGREVPEQEGCRGPSVRRAAPCSPPGAPRGAHPGGWWPSPSAGLLQI